MNEKYYVLNLSPELVENSIVVFTNYITLKCALDQIENEFPSARIRHNSGVLKLWYAFYWWYTRLPKVICNA